MTDLPAPLVPAEVDLRDYDFMPLFGDRLFKSDTWITCNDAQKIAALRSWWASWHQEPAGSLPDDDRLLADLCGYGVAVSAWKKVRPAALRGWIKCSDGRLYHPVVCEIALDVWGKKRKRAEDNAAERERKRRKRAARPPDNNNASAGQSQISGGQSGGIPAENALKEKEKKKEKDNPSDCPPSGPPFDLANDEPDILPLAMDRTAIGDAVRDWNALAERADLPRVQKLTDARRRALKARLTDCGGLDGWKAALVKIEASAFCRGRNDRGWRADFDFLLSEKSFVKLMEGKYDDRDPAGGAGGQFQNGFAQLIVENRV